MFTLIVGWIIAGLILFLQSAMEIRLDRAWTRWTRRSRWLLLAFHIVAAPVVLLVSLVGVMAERGQRFRTPLEIEDANQRERSRGVKP